MLPRIQTIRPLENYCLDIVFDDGKHVLYDVKSDIDEIPSYKSLMTIQGLFPQAALDASRTCVFWNEDIDLPSDAIYEYGQAVKN